MLPVSINESNLGLSVYSVSASTSNVELQARLVSATEAFDELTAYHEFITLPASVLVAVNTLQYMSQFSLGSLISLLH